AARLVEVQQGGDGVEQAAGARRAGAVDPSYEHTAHHRLFLPAKGGKGGEAVHRESAFTVTLKQHTQRRAARLSGGAVAAGKRERPESTEALEPCGCNPEELTAPYCAVGPETGAVPGYAQHRVFDLIFGHTREHVRVVVLHRDDGF